MTSIPFARCGASCRAEQNSASNSCKTPLVLSMAPREMLTRAKRSRWEERLHKGSTLLRGVGGGVNGARSEHRAGTARVLGWDERRWPRCEISDAAPRPHRTRMHQPRVARVSHCCAGGLPGHCLPPDGNRVYIATSCREITCQPAGESGLARHDTL
jgi:hypothetical protein